MKRSFTTLFVFSLLWSLGAWAKHENGSATLSLDQAIEEALASNPEVRASRYRVESSKARVLGAKALEDPEVGVEFMNVPISTTDVKRGEQINYMIEQKIPFPGKRYERGKAARYDVLATEGMSRGEIQDIVLDVTQTYYDLYRLDRMIEVNRESQKLLRQLRSSTETWYATGKASAALPLKVEVELTMIQNNEILLRQERLTHEAHLLALLNQRDHSSIVLPRKIRLPKLRLSIDDLLYQSGESRPEINQLKAMEKRDKAKLTAAKQGLLPDFSLGFEYNQRPGMEDAWTGKASLNLPLFFWGKNRGEIREAKADLMATKAEHEAIKNHTYHLVEEAYNNVRSFEKILGSYERQVLPRARTALHAAQTGYASNQTDFMTLIDAARSYRDLEASYYETQAELGMAFAKLERLVGTSLKPQEEN